MSNPLFVQATEFVNHPDQDRTFGVRVYDDYGAAYNNTAESIQEVMDEMNPESVVPYLLELGSEEISAMVSHSYENVKGLHINGEYYPHEELNWGDLE